MPIRLPETLPAFRTLRAEGVNVMSENQAERQDIRPLRIALLNLMPKKIETETQFARLIGATPLQIEFDLIRMSDHQSKNTSEGHIKSFYRPFRECKDERYDGLIITGAPIELMDYEQVDYWQELREIFAWADSHVHSTMAVCWGGMAALYHYYGIPKQALTQKAFGCFRHENLSPHSPYLSGLNDDFLVPVSRWTSINRADILNTPELILHIDSDETGPCYIEDPARRLLVNLNHFEYDSHTLKGEYARDKEAGKPIAIPQNYFLNDNPNLEVVNRWKSSAYLLYGNWIGEIYQHTPFDLNDIGQKPIKTERL